MSKICADCGKPIEMGQKSYYRKGFDDIGQTFHSECGDSFGIEVRVRAALDGIEYRFVKEQLATPWQQLPTGGLVVAMRKAPRSLGDKYGVELRAQRLTSANSETAT